MRSLFCPLRGIYINFSSHFLLLLMIHHMWYKNRIVLRVYDYKCILAASTMGFESYQPSRVSLKASRNPSRWHFLPFFCTFTIFLESSTHFINLQMKHNLFGIVFAIILEESVLLFSHKRCVLDQPAILRRGLALWQSRLKAVHLVGPIIGWVLTDDLVQPLLDVRSCGGLRMDYTNKFSLFY